MDIAFIKISKKIMSVNFFTKNLIFLYIYIYIYIYI